ncbi:YbaB/EbfC family nucleoid-associated protein [Pontibacter sp. G13]|uniref:YbaB/EbfC family nucleoid-associated protein n=1 Tax=Pontibacter sp. G13 TaxID=3074898 RepID=UPI00288B6CB6|nr:YbaB/EbfC family nucleoid-associated protein [Pontibacter sp. G13]WNJ19341.1 YbaB/EbfC family nucleoid-associated protein [Pontibacter sp. G13]
MFNLSDMMGKFQEMQSRLNEAKENLDNIIVESEAGGGMVRVKANASRKILKIEVDPDIIDKNDPEIMTDLITAAVNKALTQAEARGQEELQGATKGLMPNIPGLDLGKFGIS